MEGQRMEKKPGVPKKGLIIAGAVVGVLVAAYLGVCLWAGQSQSIFPHTSVAGVDVSGMTTAQAAEKLSKELEKATSVGVSLPDLRALGGHPGGQRGGAGHRRLGPERLGLRPGEFPAPGRDLSGPPDGR